MFKTERNDSRERIAVSAALDEKKLQPSILPAYGAVIRFGSPVFFYHHVQDAAFYRPFPAMV